MPCRPLILAILLSVSAQLPAVGQEVPEPRTAIPDNPSVNEPNWPPGLEEWNSDPRDPPVDPLEAERRGLTSPEVEESLPPDPTEQGTRPPTVVEGEEGEEADLYTLLSRVRSAPPGLDGQPVPRPNDLASEPVKEMPSQAPGDDDLFPENYIE